MAFVSPVEPYQLLKTARQLSLAVEALCRQHGSLILAQADTGTKMVHLGKNTRLLWRSM